MMKERLDQLYNSELKEEYLNEFENERTQKIVMRPLWEARKEEKRLGKDLYEMTLEELENVLHSLKSSTVRSAYHNANKIEEYLLWCAKKGYRRTNISPFPQQGKEEWSKKFVISYMQYAFTKEQIEDMLDELVNEQDKAVLLVLFEGVRGKGHSEVINLKLDDIHEEDEGTFLELTDIDDSKRTIQISDDLKELLVVANSQYTYINSNGQHDILSRYYSSSLEESQFVFKRVEKGSRIAKANNFFVNRKIALFKEVFELPYLRSSHIAVSGMMHMAHTIHEEYGVFTTGDARRIAEQYDTSYTSGVTGDKYRNVTIVRKAIDNEEFEKLYGYRLNIEF